MAEIEGLDIYSPEEKEEAKKVARQKKALRVLAGQERLLTLKLSATPEQAPGPGALSWTADNPNVVLEDVYDETQKPDEAGNFPVDQLKKKITGVIVGRTGVRVAGVVGGKTVRVEKSIEVTEDNIGEDIELGDAPYLEPHKGRAEGGAAPASSAVQGARSSRELENSPKGGPGPGARK